MCFVDLSGWYISLFKHLQLLKGITSDKSLALTLLILLKKTLNDSSAYLHHQRIPAGLNEGGQVEVGRVRRRGTNGVVQGVCLCVCACTFPFVRPLLQLKCVAMRIHCINLQLRDLYMYLYLYMYMFMYAVHVYECLYNYFNISHTPMKSHDTHIYTEKYFNFSQSK